MAMESFLINPARKGKRRKVSGKRRKRGGGLPSGLLSRMIRTHGIKRGMKEAWKEYRSGRRNPETLPPAYHRKAVKVHRPTVYSGIKVGAWKRSPLSKHRLVNPFGEEVMIVGANPRRRKRVVRRRKRSYLKSNPSRIRRSYSLSGRRRARRSRRNPARSGAVQISMRRPMGLLMPAVAATGGFFAADYIPAAIGMSATPLTRIGVKAGVAFGGGMLVSKFMGSKSGMFFAVGAALNALNDVMRTYIFGGTATAGFGAFAPRLRQTAGMGAMSPYSTIRSPYATS